MWLFFHKIHDNVLYPCLLYNYCFVDLTLLLQATSNSALPFLGEAGDSPVHFGVFLRFVATCRTSIAGVIVSGGASARMADDRRQKNRSTLQGSSAGSFVVRVGRYSKLKVPVPRAAKTYGGGLPLRFKSRSKC